MGYFIPGNFLAAQKLLNTSVIAQAGIQTKKIFPGS